MCIVLLKNTGLTYQLIGDDSTSTYFNFNTTTGVFTVRRLNTTIDFFKRHFEITYHYFVHKKMDWNFSNKNWTYEGSTMSEICERKNLILSDIATRSLIEESRDYYIGRIVVYDTGAPPRSATVTARININRNIYAPVFLPVNYEQTILETEATSYLVLTVTATDQDRIVRRQNCLPLLHFFNFKDFAVKPFILDLHYFFVKVSYKFDSV